jgi:excisionase family DNA binding protein
MDTLTKGEYAMSDYYSITELSKELDITRSWLYELMKDGQIMTERLGGRELVNKKDLQAFIESRKGIEDGRYKIK